MSYRPIRTASDFKSRVKLHKTVEDLYLDFKSRYDKGDNLELCRDVSQFANHEGGTLLFGIAEKQIESNGTRKKVANGFCPIENIDSTRRKFVHAIQRHCTPSTMSYSVEMIDVDTNSSILAINVEPSPPTIFVYDWQSNSMQVVKRNSHGKQYLTPDEMIQHSMNIARVKYLEVIKAFDQLEEKNRTVDIGRIPTYVPIRMMEGEGGGLLINGTTLDFSKPGTNEYSLLLKAEISGSVKQIRIPYSEVRSCCFDGYDSITLILTCNIAYSPRRHRLFLTP